MLDDIDSQIILRLAQNGRLSLTEISSHVDISRVAVAARIEKLIANKLLKISASVNLDKLNYQTLIVEAQINSRKEEFKSKISNCGKVLQSFELTGNYNHLLICSGRNNSGMRKFIESLKAYADECKVTLASNPQAPEFAQIKTPEDCTCELCGGEK